MSSPIRQADLEAYLDETLPTDQMARIELALRNNPELLSDLKAINARRDAGIHNLGEIWRRHHLSCPPRRQLGSYLLGALPDGMAAHVAAHLEVVGCRYCRANLADLERQQAESPDAVHTRRRRYFQSSAGYLRPSP